MKVRTVCFLSLLLFVVMGVKAQTTVAPSEVYFQEDDTIDIYADETIKVTNRIDAPYDERYLWDVIYSGDGFMYTDDVDFENASFSFSAPNSSIALLETYTFNIRIKKVLSDDETKCLLDTTKTFVIRVFPKPYANVIVRFCKSIGDDRGYQLCSLMNKDAQPDGMFHLTSYAQHYLRVSVPSVSNYEDQWSWSVCDSVFPAGVGPAYLYQYTDEDASEDGTVHSYVVKVRNKLPYRKEAFEDEYKFDCTIFPTPVAGVYDYIDTYSGRAVDFELRYSGGIKDGWKVRWSDKDKTYTEEEMHNVCHDVDEPTEFSYNLYLTNGRGNEVDFYGRAYPKVKVWTKPEAYLCDLNGVTYASGEYDGTAVIDCDEDDELHFSFNVKGGFEADDSWVATAAGSDWERDGDIVTCKYKVSIPDSIRNKMNGNSPEVKIPLYVKIMNVYTGENSSPDSIWYADSILVCLSLTARPMAPEQLVLKGNGTSGTVIAFVSDEDPFVSMDGYSLVFGYEKIDGTCVEHSPKVKSSNDSYRYDVFDRQELLDAANRFYVYAEVPGTNGALKSEKCYMDGEKAEIMQSVVRSFDSVGRANKCIRGLTIIQLSDGSTKKIINK